VGIVTLFGGTAPFQQRAGELEMGTAVGTVTLGGASPHFSKEKEKWGLAQSGIATPCPVPQRLVKLAVG